MNFPNWIDEAKKLYIQDKKTYKEIGEIYNVSRKTVSKYLRLSGVSSNEKYVRKINSDKLRKYNYNTCESVFKKIDTEEKAYWLGFLYADGCINIGNSKIELFLKEEDIEHLKKYRKFLGLEEKPLFKKEKDGKIGYRFEFSSYVVKDQLAKLGCLPQKTHILKFPTEKQVPKKLIHHFIRGYMDGDGCIYVSNNKISLEILGTHDFLEGYKNWVNLGNSKIYNFKHSDIKRVCNSNAQALDILSRIYNNANIYLKRKYEKYINFAVQRRKSLKSVE